MTDDQIAELRGLVERATEDGFTPDIEQELMDRLPGVLDRIDALTEALRPFAEVARIQHRDSANWPDDKPSAEFMPTGWPDWHDFRLAATLVGADGEVMEESCAKHYAAELREIAGMIAQLPDGPVRWKQYRLVAVADYLSGLRSDEVERTKGIEPLSSAWKAGA